MAAPTLPERQLTVSPPRSRPAAIRSTAAQHRARNSKVAGVLLSLAGAAILMGFITAEALYPGVYTTHTNTISHLGASEPPNSVVLQPSAAIFDITMLVTGAMILAGAWFAYRALRRKAVLIPTALLGVGATVLALDAFRSWAPMVELGEGGLERWIVYPIVLWLVAFGSYLLAIAPTDAQNPAGTEMS
jgi:hypothetical protein